MMYDIVNVETEGDKKLYQIFPQAWIQLPPLTITVRKNVLTMQLNEEARSILKKRMTLFPIDCHTFSSQFLLFKNSCHLCDLYETTLLPDGKYNAESAIYITHVIQSNGLYFPKVLLERLVFC